MKTNPFRKTKAAIEWRPGNSFYNMVDELCSLYAKKAHYASIFLLDRFGCIRSKPSEKPAEQMINHEFPYISRGNHA